LPAATKCSTSRLTARTAFVSEDCIRSNQTAAGVLRGHGPGVAGDQPRVASPRIPEHRVRRLQPTNPARRELPTNAPRKLLSTSNDPTQDCNHRGSSASRGPRPQSMGVER
jgi:hypothetical protein